MDKLILKFWNMYELPYSCKHVFRVSGMEPEFWASELRSDLALNIGIMRFI